MMAWASIDPNGPQLAIGAAKAEYPLCQQIPGCTWNKDDQLWRAPLSWATYVAFRTVWELQPITLHQPLLDWAQLAEQDYMERWRTRVKEDADPDYLKLLQDIDNNSVCTLTPPQRGGAAWLARWERCGVIDPGGTGKSPQVIRALQLAGKGALPALIICSKAALLPWQDKFARWAPELTVQIVGGTATARRKALETEADVYLIAWANVRLHTRLAAYPGQAFVRCDEHGGTSGKTEAQCEVHHKELNGLPLRTIVPDEAHRMNNTSAKQTRAVWFLAHMATYFWPITGTPVTGSVADAWTVGHGIDPRSFPVKGRFMDLFAEKVFGFSGFEQEVGLRADHAAAFHMIVQPFWRLMPREVCRPGAPPVLEPEFRYPPMDPAQSRPYKQLAKTLLADLAEGRELTPGNSAVKFGRLVQLASSAISVRDSEDAWGFTEELVAAVAPSNKVADLVEFLEDNPGQLVVSAMHTQLIELAEEALAKRKITFTKIVGGMSYEAMYQAQQWFNAGQVRVIFITVAGAESIDLQESCSTIYFLQPDPSYSWRQQKIWRLDRHGQRYPVRQVYAISPGTVDERLFELGEQKEERAHQITLDRELMRWVIEAAEGEAARYQEREREST